MFADVHTVNKDNVSVVQIRHFTILHVNTAVIYLRQGLEGT